MKNFLLFIILTLLVSTGANATAALISPLVYAAIRTDGVAGTGSASDPYDASSQAKFDAILAGLLADGGTQAITLTLGPGTYMVTPIRAAATAANPAGFVSNIPGNLTILGAGETQTFIQAGIVPTANSTYWVLAQVGIRAGDTFQNLTIDCNTQNQTAVGVTINGIQYLHVAGGATQTLASNVRIIHGGNHAGDLGNSEWFGIQFTDYQVGSVSQITHCRVDQFQGNSGCTALSANTSMTGNMVILNNGDPDGLAGHGATGGFQNAFSPAGIVSGNTCRGCTWGVYSDVDSQATENIQGNVFYTLYGGVWIYTWSPTSTLQNIYVHDNMISKTYIAGVIIGNSATTATNSNIYIYDNTIQSNISSTLHVNDLIYLTAAKNSAIYGNVFSAPPAGSTALPINIALNYCNLSTISWYGNVYSDNTPIPGPTGTTGQVVSTAAIAAITSATASTANIARAGGR